MSNKRLRDHSYEKDILDEATSNWKQTAEISKVDSNSRQFPCQSQCGSTAENKAVCVIQTE